MPKARRSGPATKGNSLERFVPFAIYRVMAKAAALAAADYAPDGISVLEARLLMLVEERPGLSAGELSVAACLEPSALSHMLRHLTGKGLVRRKRNPEERRVVQIFSTGDGGAIARRCRRISARHQTILLDGLKESEVRALRRSLQKMFVNVSGYEIATSPWRGIAKVPRTQVSPRVGKP